MKKVSINGLDVIKARIISDNDCDFAMGVDAFSDPDYTHFDMHYELEIGIVLSGSIKRLYSGLEMKLTKGQIWLTGIWEPHGLEVLEKGTEIAVFFINPDCISNINSVLNVDIDFIAPFFTAPVDRPQIKSENECYIILDIGRRAKELLLHNSKNKCTIEKLLILELLTRIQDNWSKNSKKTNSHINKYAKINPALNLIFHNNSLISLKEASNECGLNETTFSRIFKDVMGKTFSQYALVYRLRCSINDLLKNNSSIKDICYKWGFTDESHYNRLFKKYYGCNPGEYRRSNKSV